jgi:lipoprotein-anchoring transpeptidase ErfK/SrfK
MSFARGILFVLTGLVLAGCMQSGPVFDANFTPRDRQQLAHPPYQQAWIPSAYQRQIVDYHRKEAPGTIVVDTDARHVYYVLRQGKAVRYGAIVGEQGQAEIAPELTGHGLPLSKCEAYNRVYDQFQRSR